MRIGVISDTHGDAAAWLSAQQVFAGVDYIIHAGDVLYHGPRNPIKPEYNPANLAELINNGDIPVVFARGNCDANVDQMVIKYPVQAPYVYLRENGLSIMVNHGDLLTQDEMLTQAQNYKVRIFIFGHIHQPVLEDRDGVLLLNPGSCSLPKQSHATVALIEDGLVKIVELASKKVVMEKSI